MLRILEETILSSICKKLGRFILCMLVNAYIVAISPCPHAQFFWNIQHKEETKQKSHSSHLIMFFLLNTHPSLLAVRLTCMNRAILQYTFYATYFWLVVETTWIIFNCNLCRWVVLLLLPLGHCFQQWTDSAFVLE